MTARLSQDERFIIIEQTTMEERRQLELSFTKKINDWWIIKKKNPSANVDECFIMNQCIIPKGLYLELINVCNEFNYSLDFIDGFNCKIKNCGITYEGFKEYVDNLFRKNETIHPTEYQIKAAYSILSYKNCNIEVATSGGKTIISYIVFRYMKDVLHISKFLFITPNTNLTTQTAEKYIKYDEGNQIESDWTYNMVHSKMKKKDQEDYSQTIIFGNYQSLSRKHPEFFKDYKTVFIDEVQHGSCRSIKTVIKKCYNSEYVVGMTGTFPEIGSYNSFVLQAFIGPIVYRLSSYELINVEKFATPIKMIGMCLDYLSEDRKKALYNARCTKDKNDPTAGGKLLVLEKDIARKSRSRFIYIVNTISKVTKNSLVVFSDIQNSYGEKIYRWLKENTDKSLYYIDGNVDPEYREYAKSQMENDNTGNSIIVASVGTFSEGIDISNICNIFLVESTKSPIQISQLIGRGMRRSSQKTEVMFIDFGDDFRYGTGFQKNNYLFRHFEERSKIYKNKGFPYQSFNIKLEEDPAGLW